MTPTTKSSRSLRLRLIQLVLLALLPALGLIIYGAREQRQNATSNAETEALRLARILAASHQGLIDSTGHLLAALARIPEIRNGERAGCIALLAGLMREYPLYSNLAFADIKGEVFCQGLLATKSTNIFDRAYFQRAIKEQNLSLGDYQIGRATGKATLNLGYPILDRGGTATGVVFAAIDLAWFNQIVAAAELPKNSTLTLYDRHGTVLARYPESEQWIGKAAGESQIFKTIFAKTEGVADASGLDGSNRLYGFTSFGVSSSKRDIYLTIGIPADVALAGANWTLRRNLNALLIVSVMALLAAWYAGDALILRPLGVLLNATARVAAGNLSTRTGLPHGDDEVGRLAASFDKMAESLELEKAEADTAASEIAALHALTLAANQSLDLDLILQEAIKKITEIFQFAAVRVFLFDRNMEHLEVRAAYEGRPQFRAYLSSSRRAQGIVARVTESGEMLIIEDVLTDPSYAELSQSRSAIKAGSRFAAFLPIKTRLKTWGTIVCIGEYPRKLKANQVRLLESMANQVGIAVENSSLYQQTAAKAEELASLYSIAAVAGESLDIKVVLKTTMSKVLEIFGFDAARIYLCRGDSKDLHLAAAQGFPPDVHVVDKYQPGQTRIGKAFETGEPSFVENMETDSDYQQTAPNRLMFKAGFRSSFIVPLKIRGSGLGVINFLKRQPYRFSESDRQLIHAIVYHLGIAVGNANLYSKIKDKTLELEMANRAKDEFLGVMSHELRTPLNVIKGYAEVTKERTFGELNSEQEYALDKICSHATELSHMINSILQVTTIEANTVKLASRQLNPCDLLDELKSDYRIRASKELGILWDYPEYLPLLTTDHEKLKAVLQNLVNNALKFTEKGIITISALHINETQAIEFRVSDTGPGIAADKLPLIFDMFQQADSSATRRHDGVGLGLYIVKKFVDLLGGSISVQSELGKGSTFAVSLRLNGASRASALALFENYPGVQV